MNKKLLTFCFQFIVMLPLIQSQTTTLVSIDATGKLSYKADSKGTIIPDFSGVGYQNSEKPIPIVPVVKTVTAVAGDNVTNVQNAINEVAAMPLVNGFRGAVLFKAGTYELNTTIKVSASGIVLRGEGLSTIFKATGTVQYDLLSMIGASGKTDSTSTQKQITDSFVPVGTKSVTVQGDHTFVVGDWVHLRREPNEAWIHMLGMDTLSRIDPLATNWTASSYKMSYERKITAIQGNVLTFDAPVMDILDPVYANGFVVKFISARLSNCGVENLKMTSTYTSSTDELHGWNAIRIDRSEHCWVKKVTAYSFGYSCVNVADGAAFVSVDSCSMLDPISKIEGGRRYSFNVDGQRCLVQNCTTRNGRHNYVDGSQTPGPNVFYNCTATLEHADNGPHHRWSTGILFDNVTTDGQIRVQDRSDSGSGHGWSGAQIAFWNCTSPDFVVQDPPSYHCNWAIGCVGPITNVGQWTTNPLGIVESKGKKITAIPSLFKAQLAARLKELSSTQPPDSTSISVSSISALQTAINNATAGDVIVLANGHYANNTITVSKSNITVQAATPGGVFLDGNNTIVISGSNTTFSGFQFTSMTTFNGSNTIGINGNYNTLKELNFNGYCADHFVYITGRYNVVTNCNFQNKLAVMSDKAGTGDLVQIIPNATNPGYNTIRYCSFQHIPGMGGDYGNECIRIGNSTLSTFISRTTVEYCYFEDTGPGDSEAISVKSRENVLRYNTMNNNQDAMFVFRNGDNNVAYGNFFLNSGGIRVKEANNIYCYNNYFEKSGASGSMNAASLIYDTSNSTYVLDNIHFIHNTFVDCGLIDLGGIGATNSTWSNNLFKKSGIIFSNPNNGTTFKGNIYKGTLGISVPSGMTPYDPLLTLNADGYYSLSASSPCNDASDANYPALLNIPGIDTLLMDIKGKTRPALRTQKDVGCEEFIATGTSVNRPLKLSDVGPSYLKSLVSTMQTTFVSNQVEVIPNKANRNLEVTYSLSGESFVRLELFNLQGEKIRSLINQFLPSGIHKESLDIAGLAQSVYLVRISTNGYSKTVKFYNE